MTLSNSWQTSDLVDAETGLIGKRIQGFVAIPAKIDVSADQQFIEWEFGAAKAKRVQPRAFDEFLDLAGKDASSVLRFARRWGVLHENRGNGAFGGREPIDEWKFFSSRAGAVVTLASSLKKGQIGDRQTWSHLCPIGESAAEFAAHLEVTSKYNMPCFLGIDDFAKFEGSGKRKLYNPGTLLSNEVNSWLRLGGVTVEARCIGFNSQSPWEIAVDWKANLFGFLALQLAYSVCGAMLRYTCSACGKVYSRRRRPSSGSADFCSTCGRRAAVRMAERRRRGKIAEAAELASRGIDVRVIAEKLNTEPATVRGWLGKQKG